MGQVPVVGMVLGAIAVILVSVQMASEPEAPPAGLLILDYVLLTLGVVVGVGSLVVYLKNR